MHDYTAEKCYFQIFEVVFALFLDKKNIRSYNGPLRQYFSVDLRIAMVVRV